MGYGNECPQGFAQTGLKIPNCSRSYRTSASAVGRGFASCDPLMHRFSSYSVSSRLLNARSETSGTAANSHDIKGARSLPGSVPGAAVSSPELLGA